MVQCWKAISFQLFQTDYTVGSTVRANPYHIAVVRGPLTRNLARCFPRVQDEIVHAFDHVLGLHDTGPSSLLESHDLWFILRQNGNFSRFGRPACKSWHGPAIVCTLTSRSVSLILYHKVPNCLATIRQRAGIPSAMHRLHHFDLHTWSNDWPPPQSSETVRASLITFRR